MKRAALALLVCAAAFAQVAERANEHYQTREGREAVGKYLGAADRDARQKPRELVKALALKPGMTVADLGTGVGYMLPFLSRAVGPSGRVLAEDVFADFLDQAKKKAAAEKLENVEFVLGAESDPKLPAEAVDVVLVLDTYHHFNYPEKMLAPIARSLRAGGRLAVVDYYKELYQDPDHIRLNEAGVIREIEANGWRLVSKRAHVPKSQYMLVFERK